MIAVNADKAIPGIHVCLYYIFDHGDKLIYIGITAHPKDREKTHRSRSHFREEIASFVAQEWFPTRDEALAEESKRQRTLKPKYLTCTPPRSGAKSNTTDPSFITEADLRGQPFPTGLWAHTFLANGERMYQVRILRVDEQFAWCLMFSWLDGSGNEVRPLPINGWAGWKFYPSNANWIEAADKYNEREYQRDAPRRNRQRMVGTFYRWFRDHPDATWRDARKSCVGNVRTIEQFRQIQADYVDAHGEGADPLRPAATP